MLQLSDALNQAGLTKNELAKLLGVARQTVYRMGELISEDVARVLAQHNKTGEIVTNDIPIELPVKELTRKKPGGYSDDDIVVLLKRRGAGESDYNIARSVGLKVHEFNKFVHNYAVAKCTANFGRCCHSLIPDYNHQVKGQDKTPTQNLGQV